MLAPARVPVEIMARAWHDIVREDADAPALQAALRSLVTPPPQLLPPPLLVVQAKLQPSQRPSCRSDHADAAAAGCVAASVGLICKS